MKQRELTAEERDAIEVAKKELKEYRFSINYIREKLNDLEETKELVSKVTSTPSITGFTANSAKSNNDKIGDSLARIEVLEKICDEKTKNLLLKKFDIDDKIESLESPYKEILFYRYSRNMTWQEIMRNLSYSEQWVYFMHGEALYFYSKIKSRVK